MSDTPQEQPEDQGFRRIGFENTSRNGARTNGAVNGTGRVPTAATVICGICNDAQWLATPPAAAGNAPSLIPCSCQSEQRAGSDQLSAYAGLGALSSRTFDTLKKRGVRRNVDAESFWKIASQAQRFAAEPEGWLVVSGPVGSGKTHMAAAIANRIAEHGKPAKYVSALDIPDLVRSIEFGPDAEDAKTSWQAIVDAPVLILDDFGASQPNARSEARLDQLLTNRTIQPLPTVVVLARPLDQLAERFKARLSNRHLCTSAEMLTKASADDSHDRVPRTMRERMTFDTFSASGAPSTTTDEQASLSFALEAAHRFADEPDNWLYLHGPTGVGKTHLAISIAIHAEVLGMETSFWRVPDLLDKLRHGFNTDTETTFYDQFTAVKDAELLILDDFGAQAMTEWSLEKLYQLICHRHDRMLPTIVTSQYIIWEQINEPRWQQLEQMPLWESIRSRLADSSVVTECLMSAPDFRNRGA